MGVLIIDDATRKAVAELVDFASRPENYFRWKPGEPVPDDGPEHRIVLGTYGCVFTFTVGEDQHGREVIVRHLTIFCRGGLFPHPVMAEQIGLLFGFAGKLDDWQLDEHPDPAVGALRIVQIVDPAASAMAS